MMVEIPREAEQIRRGAWYVLPEACVDNRGTWAIYITDEGTVLSLAVSKLKSGQRYHCFWCPRAYPFCQHTRRITSDCPIDVDIRAAPERPETRPLDGMVSKERYPCTKVINL